MTTNFNCPNCGGMIEYATSAVSTQCPYCNSTVSVPEELHQAQEQAALNESLKKINPWLKVFFIVIIASILLPACVGILGSIVGILAGIGGPIAAIIIGLLGHH